VAPATVRFYVDADILGLATVIARLRNDVTYPGDPGAVIYRRRRPACPVESPATTDLDWIPIVAGRGWLAVTRDFKIRENRAEIEAVRSSGCRVVALNPRDGRDTWSQLEVFMSQWRAIEGLTEREGPFIVVASRTGLRDVDLS
jgi:hypothetical protein